MSDRKRPERSFCATCCNRGIVMLPQHVGGRPLNYANDPRRDTLVAISRSFPCPACSAFPVTPGSVCFIRERLAFNERKDDPAYLDHVRREVPLDMADFLNAKGFMTFAEEPSDTGMPFCKDMVGRLAVVQPLAADKIEAARIAEQRKVMTVLANDLLDRMPHGEPIGRIELAELIRAAIERIKLPIEERDEAREKRT